MKLPNEILLLAGGMGTRLRSVVSDVPKPMAHIAGRPFLEIVMDFWINIGIQRFVISSGYKSEIIKKHFDRGYRGAKIEFIDEREPLGTGGAIRRALEQTYWSLEQVLIANGDTFFDLDTEKFMADAEHLDAPVTIAVTNISINDRYGGVRVDTDGYVTEFGVKPGESSLINAGCYLVNRKSILESTHGLASNFSFEREVLAPISRSGRVAASLQTGRFIDIGIPSDYETAQIFDFKSVNIKH